MSDRAKPSVLSQQSQSIESTRPSRKSLHPTPLVPSSISIKQPQKAASSRQTRSRARSAQKTGKEPVEEDFEELDAPDNPVAIEVDIAEAGAFEPEAREPEAIVPPGKAESAAICADQGRETVQALADSPASTEEVAVSEKDVSASATEETQVATEAETFEPECVSGSHAEPQELLTTGAANTPQPEEQKTSSKREKTCTKCNFSCTNSSEFSRHLHQSHSENSQEQSPSSGISPTISARRNSKRKSVSSLPDSKMAVDKPVNGFSDEPITNTHEEDHSDDERLVIVEEARSSSTPVTPTRSGPIQNRTYTCSQCPHFTTTSARECLFHKKDVHSDNSLIYLCDICDYATKYKQKLPRHRKLHFEGQDLARSMGSRDLNDSGSSGHSNRMVEPEDDDEFQEMEAVEEEVEEPSNISGNLTMFLPDNLGGSSTKKKGTRQEVDPAKYFVVKEDNFSKFACSSCGNIYKWRKSLNKHWKEKHASEIPDNSSSPAGLEALVKQCSIRQTGPRSAIKIGSSSGDGHSPSHGQDSNRSTPLNPTQFHLPTMPALDRDSPDGGPMVTCPNTIGPFVTNSSQPVFPTATSTPLGTPRSLALYQHLPQGRMASSSDQKEPLDLSDKGADVASKQVKREPDWDGISVDPSPQAPPTLVRPPKQAPLACGLCSFVGKTSVDYGNHIRTVHNNKKEFKCASCSEHFEASEELTDHFGQNHYQEIIAYKEIIQKIPHGLQQTYHLISMPLDDIASLSTQDLNGSSAEARPLKCNICDYEAKWPADLQKHAVSHSEQRPFACMVCGSTYKWKWDLVKHFDKSHEGLPNPYKRKETSPAKPDDTGSEGASMDELTAESSNASPPPMSRMHVDGSVSDTTIPVTRGSFLETSLMSAEPQPSTSQQASDLEDIDLAQIQIPNVQSMITDMDQDSRDQQRPINAKTQRAVSETVRNRLSLNVNRSRGVISTQRQVNPGNNQQLTQSCPLCDYRARWPSEITQHMKNHSNEKPHGCPVCSYRSKWKWDVVKHLKRCGNVNGDGRSYTIHDVVDYSRRPNNGPPNVTVNMQGVISTPSTSQQSPAGANTQSAPANSPSPGVQGAVAIQVTGSSSAKPLVILAPVSTSPAPSQRSAMQPVRQREGQHGSNACERCTFVASSQAELRRHSVMHSNAKPWVCQQCGYSTRWKCDLKKHINAYSHQCSENDELLLLNFPQKCPHCNFQATQREAFEQHLRLHAADGAQERKEPAGKYLCKICNETFSEMGDYLMHIKEHSSNPNARSSPPQNDVDVQRIKHPRKNMKVHHCSECGFITNKEDKLEEHKKEEHGTTTCPYCPEKVPQKNFLAHVSNHDEFNIDEWQPYIISIAMGHSSSDEAKSSSSARQVQEGLLDHAQSEIAHRDMRRTASGSLKRSREILPCPYCMWETDNVLVLLEHIECKHPVEMEDCRQRLLRRTPTPPGSRAVLENGIGLPMTNSPKRAIDLSVLPPAPGRKGDSQARGEASYPKKTPSPSSQNVLKKRPFQCTKCVFNTTNPTMYLRHVERHNSRSKHTCWYCNYSVDRMEHLHHHMRQVHPRELKETGQTGTAQSDDGQPSSQASSPASSNQDEAPEDDVVEILEESEMAVQTTHSKPKTMLAVGQATYKGVPVEVMVVDGERRFKCLQCQFLSPDLPATARHVQQHQVAQASTPSTSSGTPAASHATTTPKSSAAGGADLGAKPKRLLRCPHCPFAHSDTAVYHTHLKYHGANKEYQCPYCNFSVGDVALLSRHVSVHENQPDTGAKGALTGAQGVCPGEDATSQQKTASKKVNATSRIRYWCSICPYNTTCKNNIRKHMKPHLVQSNYRCDQCNYSATRQYLLEQHRTYHDCEPQTPIGPQDVVYDPQENESEVMDTPDEDEEEEAMDEEVDGTIGPFGEKQFRAHKCLDCPFSSNSSSEFRKHCSLHNANNTYKCDYCSYGVERMNLLTQHRRLHADEPGFVSGSPSLESKSSAQIVGTKSKLSSSPQGHTAAGEDEELLRCQLCPFSTDIPAAMEQHSSQHGSHREFTCDFCDWSDKSVAAVMSHRFVHHQEPSFKASPDARIFLNKQMEVDEPQESPSPAAKEQAKPPVPDPKEFAPALPKKTPSGAYRCPICSFSTYDRAQYDLHYRLHSSRNLKNRESRKRYRCNLCPYTTLSLSLVIHHKERHKRSRVPASSPPRQEAASQDAQLDKKDPIKAEAAASFPCEVCPFSAGSEDELQGHKEGHEKEGPVRCMMCKFFAKEEDAMVDHIRASHHQELDREVVLKLLQASMGRNGLSKMEVETNNNNPSTKLPVIEKENTLLEKELVEERKEIKAEESKEVSTTVEGKVMRVYLCRVCDMDFPDKAQLKEHEEAHDMECQ